MRKEIRIEEYRNVLNKFFKYIEIMNQKIRKDGSKNCLVLKKGTKYIIDSAYEEQQIQPKKKEKLFKLVMKRILAKRKGLIGTLILKNRIIFPEIRFYSIKEQILSMKRH